MRTAAETAPDLSAELLRQVVEAAADGVVIADAAREGWPVVFANPAFERITGYSSGEVLGRGLPFLQGDDRDQPDRSKLIRAMADGLPCTAVLREHRKDGSLFWSEITVSPVRERSGRAAYFIGFQRDVTARIRQDKALEEQRAQLEHANRALARLVTHDPLTDVANRRFLLDMLAREWKRAQRESTPVSVLLIDLDSFRSYNDLFGQDAGDRCLKQVAAELEGELKRPADILARYGGGEFASLLPGTDVHGALQVAENMRLRVRALHLEHAGSSVDGRVTVSVGIATAVPVPEIAMEELVVRADRALRGAKEAGRDLVRAWSDPGAMPED